MSDAQANKKRVHAAMEELDVLQNNGSVTEGTYLLMCDALKLKFATYDRPDNAADDSEDESILSTRTRLAAEAELHGGIEDATARARTFLEDSRERRRAWRWPSVYTGTVLEAPLPQHLYAVAVSDADWPGHAVIPQRPRSTVDEESDGAAEDPNGPMDGE